MLLTPVAVEWAGPRGSSLHDAIWAVHLLPLVSLAYRWGMQGSLNGSLFSLALLLATYIAFDKPVDEMAVSLTVLVATSASSFLIANMVERLKKESLTDALTGLWNRRAFAAQLARHLSRPSETALVLFDLDDFKQVNDRFGHPAGDALLKAVAAAAQNVVRPGDVVARIGGDEFAVILPRTSAAAAARVAQRITLEIANIRLGYGPCSASFGFATAHGCSGAVRELCRAADQSLYQAKRRKNLTAFAGSGRQKKSPRV